MLGLRRAIETQMVLGKVAVTTAAQVLGHTEIRATKQYISLVLGDFVKIEAVEWFIRRTIETDSAFRRIYQK